MAKSKQGTQNFDQSTSQVNQQAANLHKEEFGSDYTYGNTNNSSQKKSGKQLNKRKK